MIGRSTVFNFLKYVVVAGLLSIIVVTIRTSPAPIAYGDMLLTRWSPGASPAVGRTRLGTRLSCADQYVPDGIGTVAPSKIAIEFSGNARKLTGECCVDDRCRASGVIRCSIKEGKNVLFVSDPLGPGDTPQLFSVDVSSGSAELTMDQEGDGTGCTLATWAELCAR